VPICDACGARIWGARADTRYCSGACKQRAYRERLRLVRRYGCTDLDEVAEIQEMGDASERDFEAALSEARAQGDLSRENVLATLRRYASTRNAR
jgi:hypothetical protein